MLDVDEKITDPARLRELIPGWPGSNTELKVTDRITPIAKSFIAASPFVAIATKASDGLIDVSPKGDPAGFVEVYDEKTLIIPDRLGNGRVDGFLNILTDPAVGLIFLVPGHGDTLRVAGRAHLVRDDTISARLAVGGRKPLLAMVVEVEEVFMHCSKAFIRSRLWQSEHWPARGTAPTLAEWVVGTVDKEQTLDDVQAIHSNDEKTRLY